MTNAADLASNLDVLVVGAGISGISAAYHLTTESPETRFAVVEARDSIGGTWDLFRYPGVRSDSDMHTLGFSFKPWIHERAIADGPAILDYLEETVDEFDLRKHMHFGRRVQHADWSSADQRWAVTIEGSRSQTIHCRFLYVCAGYYRYSSGYTPTIPGLEDFSGRVVHPQHWPSDLDVNGQNVIVVGSGATAVTLVPALAAEGAQVTMLQRSPSYVAAQPDVDAVANNLRRALPDRVAYRITRVRNIARDQMVYRMTRVMPQRVRAELLARVGDEIGRELTEQHFTPSYNPWDERLCLVPNGDLFEAINSGGARVVTDTIERITASGIEVSSGDHLDADIIVTATGLQLVTLGQIAISVDGVEIDFSETWSYRGIAYSGVPNLVSTFGYINASWTLRADMIAQFVTRLLAYMDAHGWQSSTPRLRPADRHMIPKPWVDDFLPGYIRRSIDDLPKQGDREPWINHQAYLPDRRSLTRAPLDDGALHFA